MIVENQKMTAHSKPINGKPHASEKVEAVARAIDDLIMARIEAATSPSKGAEVADERHKNLTEALRR